MDSVENTNRTTPESGKHTRLVIQNESITWSVVSQKTFYDRVEFLDLHWNFVTQVSQWIYCNHGELDWMTVSPKNGRQEFFRTIIIYIWNTVLSSCKWASCIHLSPMVLNILGEMPSKALIRCITRNRVLWMTRSASVHRLYHHLQGMAAR